MSLATVADLELFLGATFTATDEDRAQLLLDLATGAIQRFTRQTIELVEDDEVTLAGNWTGALVLPQVPVVDVTAVELVDVETLTVDEDYIWDGQRTLWRGAVVPGLDAASPGGNWGGDRQRVTVTYSHGWATIPDEIRGVCLQIATRSWRNPALVSAESVGQYSVTYGAAAQGIGISLHERAILGDLRRKWMAEL